MKSIIFTLLGTFLSFSVFSQTARVQIIHNAPNPTVDIYANGNLLLNNFAFREATAYLDLPADVSIDIAVAPDTSTSAASAIANFPVMFESGKIYSVIATGVVGSPDRPFTLSVNDQARETANEPGNVDILAFHGSPDAPAVDLDAFFVGNLLSNFSYGSFSANYLSVPADQYFLGLKVSGQPNTIAIFDADLSGAAGAAITVFASGFLTQNPGFGFFAALPNGQVIQLPLNPGSNLQVIHNSPSPTVDVYANGALFINDFEFQTASPFTLLPSGTNINIAIAPGNSTSVDDAIADYDVNLTGGSDYVAVAAGIVGDMDNPFNLYLNDMARTEANDPTQIDLMVFHGSPGAPNVDISPALGNPLISDLAFGSFSDYLSLDPDNYFLEVKPTGTNNLVGTFGVNLNSAAGLSLVAFASGIVGGSPEFDVLAALPNGAVVRLVPVSLLQIIHNSPEASVQTVDIYADTDRLVNDLSFRESTGAFFVPSRTPIDIGVAPGTSTSSSDVIANFPGITFQDGRSYTVIANGIPGNPDTPFDLAVFDQTRVLSETAGNVDLLVFHGSPGAPSVDVGVDGGGLLVEDLSFGNFDGYLSVPADQYFLQVFPNASADLVATFNADLSDLGGLGVTVFASGLLGAEPAFGLFAALFDGTVVPLQAVSKAQVIHNSPDPSVDVYANTELFLEDFEFRQATPYVYLPTNTDIELAVAPAGSASSDDAIFRKTVNLDNGTTYVVMASGVVGNADAPFDLVVSDQGLTDLDDQSKVGILAYHGSPDAPDVDVVVDGGPILFDDLAFGSYSAPALVDPLNYRLNITPANDNNNVVASFGADLVDLSGEGLVVFASGFFDGTMPGFGLWVATEDGNTFPLPTIVSSTEIEEKVENFVVGPNPVYSQAQVTIDIAENLEGEIDILDVNGRLIKTIWSGMLNEGTNQVMMDASDLTNGYYYINLRTSKGNIARSFMLSK
jgi:hypothetical protein